MRFDHRWVAVLAVALLGSLGCRELYEPGVAPDESEQDYRLQLVDGEGRPWAFRSVRLNSFEPRFVVSDTTDIAGGIRFSAPALDVLLLELEIDDPAGQSIQIPRRVQLSSASHSRIEIAPEFREHAVRLPFALRSDGGDRGGLWVRRSFGAGIGSQSQFFPITQDGRLFLTTDIRPEEVSQSDFELNLADEGRLRAESVLDALLGATGWTPDLRRTRLHLTVGGLPLAAVVDLRLASHDPAEEVELWWSDFSAPDGRAEVWAPARLDEIEVDPEGDTLFRAAVILGAADADSIVVELGEHEVELVVRSLAAVPISGVSAILLTRDDTLSLVTGFDGRIFVRANDGPLTVRLNDRFRFSPWSEATVWIHADTTLSFVVEGSR